MTDVLLRDVPDDVVAAVDARAARVGLSRSEYLRRRLAQELVAPQPVTAEDLSWFSEAFAGSSYLRWGGRDTPGRAVAVS